jgi:GTPase SAR1 family protein
MFDVTDQASFDALSNWFDEVATYSSKTRSSSVADPSRYPQLVLCGNKIDVADKRVVSADKAYVRCSVCLQVAISRLLTGAISIPSDVSHGARTAVSGNLCSNRT